MVTPSGRERSVVVKVTKLTSKFSDSTIMNRIDKIVSSQRIPTTSGTNPKNNYRESVSSINPTKPHKNTVTLVQMLTQTTPASSTYISSATGLSKKKVPTKHQSRNYSTNYMVPPSSPLTSDHKYGITGMFCKLIT